MLIGLCGFRRAGKDTVAAGLVRLFRFQRLAFVDAIRREVHELDGFPEVPDAQKDVLGPDGLSYRDRLIARGQGRRSEDPDYWVKAFDRAVSPVLPASRIVVSDCRFDNELNWVRSHGGVLVWVHRDGVTSNGHVTERDRSAQCDLSVHNDWSEPEVLAARVIAPLLGRGLLAA